MYTAAQTCLCECSVVVQKGFILPLPPTPPHRLLSTCSLTFVVFTHHTQICQMHTCLSDPSGPPPAAPSKVEAVFASRWTQPGPFDRDDQQSIDRGCHASVKPPTLLLGPPLTSCSNTTRFFSALSLLFVVSFVVTVSFVTA